MREREKERDEMPRYFTSFSGIVQHCPFALSDRFVA
jgi:hypothetical protein